MRLVALIVGALIGTVAGYFIGVLLVCSWPQAGNLCGVLGIFLGVPLGLVIGAVAGWRLSRPRIRQFRVFRHPTQGTQAVKVGVSWPAFFFTFFWLLAKELWSWAGLWAGVALILSVFQTMAHASLQGTYRLIAYLVVFAGDFALALVPLLKGNGWREANLKSRGYELLSTTTAATPAAAIAYTASARGFRRGRT